MDCVSIAAKIGCSGERLRNWVRQAQRDRGERAGLSTSQREAIVSASVPTAMVTPQASPELSSKAFVDTYCVTCHNQRLKTAGLLLDTMDVTDVAAYAPQWEKAVVKLRAQRDSAREYCKRWSFVGPFSGLIRKAILKQLKVESESQAKA